jgi:hypothetical protein
VIIFDLPESSHPSLLRRAQPRHRDYRFEDLSLFQIQNERPSAMPQPNFQSSLDSTSPYALILGHSEIFAPWLKHTFNIR